MKRCPRPSCGGQILTVCLLCGHADREDEPTLLERLLSNASPENLPNCGPRPVADPAEARARLDRVMARLHAEAQP